MEAGDLWLHAELSLPTLLFPHIPPPPNPLSTSYSPFLGIEVEAQLGSSLLPLSLVPSGAWFLSDNHQELGNLFI